jgi:amino acid transporter
VPPVAPAGDADAEPTAGEGDETRTRRRVLLVVLLVLLGLIVAGVIVAGVVFGWDQIRSEVSGLVTP